MPQRLKDEQFESEVSGICLGSTLKEDEDSRQDDELRRVASLLRSGVGE